MYYGVGRVLRVQQFSERAIHAVVEPIPSKTDGVDGFFDSNNDSDLHYMLAPAFIGDKAVTTETTTNAGQNPRPKKQGVQPIGRFSSNTLRRKLNSCPELGAESIGYYFAPGGNIYVGVGKVIATGINARDWFYVYVEPSPGKNGGDYDFYNEATLEFMPDFSSCTSPRSRFPWRDHFIKSLSELVPPLQEETPTGGEA
ncbi:hypothetical protein BJY01DRAFT_251699 [Aspergillus pseudoustus]|uniref:Uncharacterized protein n=1 Tax=Aspergillus pseudoustus TaxID=1810923 RepID=A0ABR4JAB4_9EURO